MSRLFFIASVILFALAAILVVIEGGDRDLIAFFAYAGATALAAGHVT